MLTNKITYATKIHDEKKVRLKHKEVETGDGLARLELQRPGP